MINHAISISFYFKFLKAVLMVKMRESSTLKLEYHSQTWSWVQISWLKPLHKKLQYFRSVILTIRMVESWKYKLTLNVLVLEVIWSRLKVSMEPMILYLKWSIYQGPRLPVFAQRKNGQSSRKNLASRYTIQIRRKWKRSSNQQASH